MKTITKLLFFVALVCFFETNYAQDIDHSTYRIAISSDGNAHDEDDICASATGVVLIAEACEHKKYVHHDYSNHIWYDEGTQAEEMKISVEGAVSRWNMPDKAFEVRVPAELTAAITNFAAEGNASSADDRLYYACGGPMEVPYQCISAVDEEKQQYITAVNHSVWNENWTVDGSHNWADIEADLGCQTITISNQNTNLAPAKADFNWLNEMGGDYAWLYSRNTRAGTWDCSDAGLVWYILSGRTDQLGNAAKMQTLFQDTKYACSTTGTEQTITFNTLPTKVVGDADFAINATTTSGLPVYYSSSNTNVATIVDGNIHIVSGGTAMITASQWGNDTYKAAETVEQSLTVEWSTVPYEEQNGFVIMEAENTQSPLGLWILKTDVADYKGTGHIEFTGNATNTGPPTSPLTYTFKVQQAGTYQLFLRCRKRITPPDDSDKSNDCYVRVEGDYDASPNAGDTHLSDAPKSALIEDTKIFGGSINAFSTAERLDLGGELNKRLPKYVFKAGEVYTFVMSGRSKQFNVDRIIFSRLEDRTLAEAKTENLLLNETVTAGDPSKLTQTITFNTLDERDVKDADFSPEATASSGLAVSYVSSNTSVAVIVNDNIQIVSSGSTTITASQSGNDTYNPAQNVSRTLVVKDGDNLASNGTATQSSTIVSAAASRAIDGNISGVWSQGSVTHTSAETNAWWQVELENNYSIGEIKIFNRTDCCTDRLSNFTVSVIDTNGNTNFQETITTEPSPSITLNANGVQGKVVRITSNLEDTALTLAEVQVFEGSSLSVSTTILEEKIKIYPNSFKDEFTITLSDSKTASYTILNLVGQTVLSGDINRNYTRVDATTLSSGIYLLRVSSTSGNFIKKIVKDE